MVNFVETVNDGATQVTDPWNTCDDVWIAGQSSTEQASVTAADSICSIQAMVYIITASMLTFMVRSPLDPFITMITVIVQDDEMIGCDRDFGPTAGEYLGIPYAYYASGAVAVLAAFNCLEQSRKKHGWEYPVQMLFCGDPNGPSPPPRQPSP